MVNEANLISKELKRDVKFNVTIVFEVLNIDYFIG